MTAPHDFATDAGFEAELRAMLERRAADVHPTRHTGPATLDSSTLDRTADVGPGPDVTVIPDRLAAPLDRPRAGSGPRGVRIAAAVVLLVGVAGLATLAAGGGSTTETGPATESGAPAVIWPVGETVAPDQLATPEAATRAYLAEAIGADPNLPLDGTEVRGADATVRYTLDGIPAAVALTTRDGRWLVTGATNDLVVIDRVSAPHGTRIDVEVAAGPLEAPVPRLRARLVEPAGQVWDTADVEMEAGEPVAQPGPPLADGSWETYLFVGETTDPVAVRVDVLSDDGDGDPVLAHASVPVPEAPDGAAAQHETTTSAPPITIDPSPQPLPPEPDPLPALSTDAGDGGRAPGMEGWQDAATALLETVVDEDGPAGTPTFSDVSVDEAALTIEGRYSAPDGDVGTFAMTRSGDGRWGMTALRSDALEVVEVGASGSRVQVVLLSTKDADLGVGGFRVGPAPGGSWVSAGDPAVFSTPCDGSARLFLYLDAADGAHLRFADAWPC